LGQNCLERKAQKVKRSMGIFSLDANDTPLVCQSTDENDPANQRSAHTEGKVKRICAYTKKKIFIMQSVHVWSAQHQAPFLYYPCALEW